MIKVYKIKIGEKVYEVEVEAVSEKEGKIEVSKKEEKPVGSSSGSETKVEAPLQGLVLSIEVNKGDTVKSGQNLVIIEAMKMENPIVAPVDGVVMDISVSKGDTVENGDILVILS